MGLDSTEVRERECVCVCLKDPSVTGMFAYTHHWGLTDAFWPRRSALRCPPGRRPGGVCRGRRCLSDNTEKKDRPREQIYLRKRSEAHLRSLESGHHPWVIKQRGGRGGCMLIGGLTRGLTVTAVCLPGLGALVCIGHQLRSHCRQVDITPRHVYVRYRYMQPMRHMSTPFTQAWSPL